VPGEFGAQPRTPSICGPRGRPMKWNTGPGSACRTRLAHLRYGGTIRQVRRNPGRRMKSAAPGARAIHDATDLGLSHVQLAQLGMLRMTAGARLDGLAVRRLACSRRAWRWRKQRRGGSQRHMNCGGAPFWRSNGAYFTGDRRCAGLPPPLRIAVLRSGIAQAKRSRPLGSGSV
jgi:hypothetical protein